MVDDFAIQYTSLRNSKHLLNALKTKYGISEDQEANIYIGILLKWDYAQRNVDLSTPGYITAALLRFRHMSPIIHKYSPHRHVAYTYGAAVQYTTPENDHPLLPTYILKYIQQVVGILLYYGIAINKTILVALGNIAAKQSHATLTTIEKTNQLLDYLESKPHATTRYHASGTILFIHSDESYLSVSKSCSRASGVFFISDTKPDALKFSEYTPLLNGFIFVLCKILHNIMASADEAKYGALFLNGQEDVLVQTTLIEMNQPQPPSPSQVNNFTAVVI